MPPLAHLIGSWLIASATTNNPRGRKLVALAGILRDADGLGAVADVIGLWIFGKECAFYFYQTYHHLLLQGWPGAIAANQKFLERRNGLSADHGLFWLPAA